MTIYNKMKSEDRKLYKLMIFVFWEQHDIKYYVFYLINSYKKIPFYFS